MIASPALHVLVALAIAAPPADPSACAADDLQCSGPAFAAAARRAKSDVQRVQYLYFAHRAYLGLADQRPGKVASRDLCRAHRLIAQALALPATPLRARIVASERETRTRLVSNKVQCRRSGGDTKDLPLLASTKPPANQAAQLGVVEPTPEAPTAPPATAAPQTEEPAPLMAGPNKTTTPEGKAAALNLFERDQATSAPRLPPVQTAAGDQQVEARSQGLAGEPVKLPIPPGTRRSRAQIGVGAGLVTVGVGLLGGMTAALVARRSDDAKIAAVGALAVAEDRPLTPGENADVAVWDSRYSRLENTGKVLGTLAGLSILAGVLVLVMPPKRRGPQARLRPMGAGVFISF